jgi:hypothetical protein
LALANHFGCGISDNQGGRLVDADSQQLGIRLHQRAQVLLTIALGEMLVDRNSA